MKEFFNSKAIKIMIYGVRFRESADPGSQPGRHFNRRCKISCPAKVQLISKGNRN
jgi:hypothetical protein